MSEYCRQCSINVFGHDYGDLAGLAPPGQHTKALCEACEHPGPCIVDRRGVCQIREPQRYDRDAEGDDGATLFGPLGSTFLWWAITAVGAVGLGVFLYEVWP